jgi:hypothetical protein
MPEVRVLSAALSSIDLRERLQRNRAIIDAELQFELIENQMRFRGVEPTLLVAIVGAAGTALGTLVSGLLQIARETHSAKIIVQAKDGRRVECPADMPSEKVKELVELMREMDSPTVRLS